MEKTTRRVAIKPRREVNDDEDETKLTTAQRGRRVIARNHGVSYDSDEDGPAKKTGKGRSHWSEQARRWCWTFNNYTPEDIVHLLDEINEDDFNFMVFQPELAPSTGTPHLQGYTEFAKKVTKKQACEILDARAEKAFKSGKISDFKIKVEKCNGNRQQNIDYCTDPSKRDPEYPDDEDGYWEVSHKVPTRGKGVKSEKKKTFKTSNQVEIDNPYVDAMETLRYIETAEEEIDFYMSFPEITFKHLPNIKLLLQTFKGAEGLAKAMLRLPQNIRLPLWGRGLVNLITNRIRSPDREIIWIWSEIGDVYKTFMAKYFMIYHDALLVDNGKSADLAFIWTGQPIIWFDLACSGNEDAVNFHAIEKFKNGIVMSPKYQSMIKIYDAPWIICTANFTMPRGKVKNDRPLIMKLTEASRELEPMHDGLIEIKPDRLSTDELSELREFGLDFHRIDESTEES